MKRIQIGSACILLTWLAALGGQPGYKVMKFYSLTSIDKIEYFTRDELLEPFKKKMEKGKLDKDEYKIKESMTPKGGILGAKITTQKKFLSEPDPVVSIKVLKDSNGTALETCDSDTQNAGITNQFNNFTQKYELKEDENNPTMVFECGFKRPLPDTFYLDLVTFEGKSKSKYRMVR
ncbi:MAG: hypothetical protein JWO30_2191 [Fibrobacteres bacterium]|nr:hypothetical protein [Fibrobacterota bacterium]